MADRVTKLKDSRRTPSAIGMTNQAGDYNCFLNVVIQSLWHMKSFQDAFSDFPEHTHASAKESCVLCALYTIFLEYRNSDGRNLSSVDLRTALSEAFAGQQRFQEKAMADAGECYIELIQLISSLLPTEELKTKLIHSIFETSLEEQVICSKCDYNNTKPEIQETQHLLHVSKIVEAAEKLGEKPFDELIGAVYQADSIPCTKCQSEAMTVKRFKNLPAVYSLSLIWPSTRPHKSLINDFFNTVSMEIDLANIAPIDPKVKKSTPTKYRLRGMILYYGRHYTAAFYHASLHRWLQFDDSLVTPMSAYWWGVTQHCVDTRYQPSMLFYEREDVSSYSDFYEPVPQDVIPRVYTPPVVDEKPAVVCPALEGPMYRKQKKQWVLQWVKLQEWTLRFYDKPQKVFSPAHGRWVKSRNMPPTIVIPLYAMTEVEMDAAGHNFSKKPFYMKFKASISTAASAGPSTSATNTSHTEDYCLFVENEAPFVQWLTALTRAQELLKTMQQTERDHIRRNSFYVNNGYDTPANGTGTSSTAPDSGSALDFAPNASLEDLRRIAEMESGSPRDDRSDEEDKTTILHPSLPSVPASSAQPSKPQTPSQAPMAQNGANGTGTAFYDPFQQEK